MIDILKWFKPVQSMDVDEAKDFIKNHEEGSYNLVDVRQHKEYEKEHIPGAKLIPLSQLEDNLEQLDPEKPTIVHCAIGGRSRIAASKLADNGFKEVYNLSGGIKAWQGEKTTGPVGLNMDIITGKENPLEIVKLAYGMEEGLGGYYRSVMKKTDDKEVASLLEKLASIEDRHKDRLMEVYKTIDASATEEKVKEDICARTMEGGFDFYEFKKHNEQYTDSVSGILTLAMMIEAQAMDLYSKFADSSENQDTKKILHKIADEEKAHLTALEKLQDEKA
jgi:rhodanese-related sulfurtransferase/rubrerythrin